MKTEWVALRQLESGQYGKKGEIEFHILKLHHEQQTWESSLLQLLVFETCYIYQGFFLSLVQWAWHNSKWKEQSLYFDLKNRPLSWWPVRGGWNEEIRLSSYRKEVFFSFCLGKIICGVVCPVAKAKVVKMDWGYRNFISCFLKISTTSGLTSSSNATLINWRQKRLSASEALRISS